MCVCVLPTNWHSNGQRLLSSCDDVLLLSALVLLCLVKCDLLVASSLALQVFAGVSLVQAVGSLLT